MKLQSALLVACLTSEAAAQLRQIRLKPANAVLQQEFSSISSLRELSDGRVLITDPRDLGLVVADFRTNMVELIGRKGRGPHEYEFASHLHGIAADSTLMIQPSSRRWLILAGDRIVKTVPPDAPAIVATQALFSSADHNGFVVTRRAPPRRPGVTIITEKDSYAVVRVRRTDGQSDTLTRVRRAPARLELITDSSGRVLRSSGRPTHAFAVGEEFILQPDGWLAIARLDPFRIDWRSPNGTWTLGRALAIPLVRVTRKERQAYNARRSSAELPVSSDDDTEWPEFIPPFGLGALQSILDGRVLIQRTKSADHPGNRYVVVNRRGELEGEIVLPANQTILAFGRAAVYVIERNDDDVQRLRRHSWR